MVAGNLQVIIDAVDNASAKIRGVAGAASGAFNGISKVANVAGLALGAAGLAVGGVLGLGSKLAADSQQALTSAASAANNWSSLTGDSFKAGQEIVSGMTKELTAQAKVLPGTTQQYIELSNAVLDNVVGAYTDASGKIDKSSSMGWIENNIAGLEILRQAAGATAGQTAKDISTFLGGQYKSQKSMLQTQFFAGNPTMMTNLEKAAKSFGFETLDAMLKSGTKKQLAEALGKATSASITEELKNELGNSFEGAVEGIKTQLFDPNEGLFGGLRKFTFAGVETDLNRAIGSRISRIGQSVSQVMSEFQKVAEILGIETDPLVLITGAFEGVANFAEGVSAAVEDLYMPDIAAAFKPFIDVFNNFASGFKMPDFSSASAAGADIGKMMASLISLPSQLISKIDTGQIASVASGLGQGLVTAISSFIVNIDWGSMLGASINIGAAMAGLAQGIIQGSMAAIGQALQAIGNSLSLGISNVVLSAANGITGFLSGIGYGIAGIWQQAQATISTTLMAAGVAISTSMAGLGALFSGIGARVMAVLSGIAATIGSALQSGLAAIGSALQSGFQSLIAAGMAAVGGLAGIGGTIAGIISAGLAAIGQRIIQEVQGLIQAAQSFAASLPGIGGLIGGGGSAGIGVASRAKGQNLSSVSAAISREQRMMPSGSEIVVANSSEAIVPQNRLSQFASSVASRPQQQTGNMQITFNINGALQPEAIVAQVEQRLKQMQTRSARTMLA